MLNYLLELRKVYVNILREFIIYTGTQQAQ